MAGLSDTTSRPSPHSSAAKAVAFSGRGERLATRPYLIPRISVDSDTRQIGSVRNGQIEANLGILLPYQEKYFNMRSVEKNEIKIY
jgi:hypothetical protein